MINTHNLRLARHYGVFGDGFCACRLCKEKRTAGILKRNLILAGIALIILIIGCNLVHASTVIIETDVAGFSLNQWCEAIRHAEGVNSAHPYGILAHYKRTTPLQACRNTVLHKYRDYQKLQSKHGERKRFLDYLANQYCPIGGNTDDGTCKNWSTNVNYWLKKG